jgi:hypothetical protein
VSDLIEFLRARLDEDERVALEVSTGPNVPEKWTASQYREGVRPWRIDGQCSLVVEAVCGPDAAHIVRHQPARVAVEVEAKRGVIREAFRHASKVDSEWGCCHTAEAIEQGECEDHPPNELAILRFLAAPYAAHSDYRQEWRP